MHMLLPSPKDFHPRPLIKHLPPPKRGGSDIGEWLLSAVLITIALMSLGLFWQPFRDDAMMIAADNEAAQRTPLLIDVSGHDGALKAIHEIRLCAQAWRQELGRRAEFYCVTRIAQQYRELPRTR
jgi:hypothetical protein